MFGWWNEHGTWFDLNGAASRLYDDHALTGQMWAQIGVTTLIWLVIPLTFGLRSLFRAEVK